MRTSGNQFMHEIKTLIDVSAISSKFRRVGYFLSQIIMPNMSLFIISGGLSLAASIAPIAYQASFSQLNYWLVVILLPILISYTAGQLSDKKYGGTVGVLSSLLLFLSSQGAPLIGCMFTGFFSGLFFKKSMSRLNLKIKNGYEMLIRNLVIGGVAVLFWLASKWLLLPVLSLIINGLSQAVGWLIQQNLLPLVSLVIEPLKVFFFNNALNHGVLTPIGLDMVKESGTSILFLLETNPGPGLGVLVASLMLDKDKNKRETKSAIWIELFGGVHEVYFPYILSKTTLLVAVILGGFSGTLFFQLTDTGLVGPVSPGSILLLLANSPFSKMGMLLGGVFLSASVSFISAWLLLKREVANTSTESGEQVEARRDYQIIFACDAGMGSSAMGASLLARFLKREGWQVPVSFQSVHELEDNQNSIILVQAPLYAIAQEAVPSGEILRVENFLEYQAYYPELLEILKEHSEMLMEKQEPEPVLDKSVLEVIILYEGNRRGSAVIGQEILRKTATQLGISIRIKRQSIDELQIISKESMYIVTENLAKHWQLVATLPNYTLVTNLADNHAYIRMLKEDR